MKEIKDSQDTNTDYPDETGLAQERPIASFRDQILAEIQIAKMVSNFSLIDDPGGEAPGNELGIEIIENSQAHFQLCESPINISRLTPMLKCFRVEDTMEDTLSTVKVRLTADDLQEVNIESLRLYKYIGAIENYKPVERSGMSTAHQFLYAKIFEPGIYAIFGEPNDAPSRVILEMQRAAREIEVLFNPGDFPPFINHLCKLVACPGDFFTKEMLTHEYREGKGIVPNFGEGYSGHDLFPESIRPRIPNAGTALSFCDRCDPSGIGLRIPRDADPLSTRIWTFAGPTNISGRIRTLYFQPGQSIGKRLYAASPGGGVWLSRDRGKSWIPLMNSAPSLNIGDIVVSQNNHRLIIASSGEYVKKGITPGNVHMFGDGIYASLDEGASWSRESKKYPVRSASRVLLHPTDDDIVFICGHEGVFRYHRTTDQWTRLLDLEATDMMFFENSHHLIAALEDVSAIKICRNPLSLTPSWTDMNNGLSINSVPITIDNPLFIKLASIPSDPGQLYCCMNKYDTANNRMLGFDIFRWNGSIWTRSGFIAQRGRKEVWSKTISVHPINDQLLYVGAQKLHVSKDGGRSWVMVNGGKDRYYDVTFNPTDPNEVLLANDHGVFRGEGPPDDSSNPVTVFVNSSKSLHTVHLNYFSMGGQLFGKTVGTSQSFDHLYSHDNKHYSIIAESLFNTGKTFIDNVNSQILYIANSFRGISVSQDGGSTISRINNGLEGRDRSVWTLSTHPTNSNIVLMSIIVNLGGGVSKRQIYRSDQLSTYTAGGAWSKVLDDTRVVVHKILFAPSNPDIVYLLTRNSKLYVSSDSGKSFRSETTNLPRNYLVTTVIVDKHSATTLYASAWNRDLVRSKFLKSTNGGITWSEVIAPPDQSLPNYPIGGLNHSETTSLFARSGRGVFQSDDLGLSWKSINADLPRVNLSGLVYKNGILYAATLGRGIWKRQVTTSEPQMTIPWVDFRDFDWEGS